MTRLAGKRVLLTGAAGGIGRELATRLARRGCELVLLDRDAGAVHALAEQLRGDGAVAHPLVIDLTDRAALESGVTQALQRTGPIDIIVNNAGVGHLGELHHTSLETWRWLMDVNFWAPLQLTDLLLPAMLERRSGHVVNVSSGQAFFRLPTWGAYAATKAALGVLSEVAGYELAKHGIRVTTVYPYMVDTGFYGDIEAETWGARLALALIPWYSMRPGRVADIIVEAIERDRRIELVSPINHVGRLAHGLGAGPVIGRMTELLLTRGSTRARASRAGSGGLGFHMEELMRGHHAFDTPDGPGERQPMWFRLRWGPPDVRRWADHTERGVLTQPAEGTIHVEGLVDQAACTGTLELRYLRDASIRYTLEFEAQGRSYRFTGEKNDIRPWNLPFSHTRCFGTIVDARSGRLVSRAMLRFPLTTLPQMLASLRVARPGPATERNTDGGPQPITSAAPRDATSRAAAGGT